MNDDTLDAVIALFHEKGSDAWFTDAPESYLGDACVCPKYCLLYTSRCV